MIACPHCGKAVALTTALRHELEKDFAQQFAKQEAQLQSAIKQREAALQQKEAVLQQQIAQRETELKEAVARQLEREKAQLETKLKAEAAALQAKEVQDLTARLQEKEAQLKKADALELALRRKQRELEERERRQEIELARRLDTMRQAIVEQTVKQSEEMAQLKIQEKDKQLEQLKKTIQELRQQSEQASMQVQGDAAETSLKERLQAACPYDRISDVVTGQLGADLIQSVMNGERHLGTIIWEAKRTKGFSEQWVSKLKRDQTEVKADLAVLVTAALPKEISSFAERNGVWICSVEFAIPLALVLRAQLILLAKAQLATQDRSTKSQQLYHYISSSEFRNRIEHLVVTFVDMQRDLDRESRALAVALKRRRKQLESLVYGTAGMYGDLQGIIGGALPKIEQLELADDESPAPPQLPNSLFDV